ncbi:uncharacterized protein LOC115623280 [Scaptodrosophila lebanonensis]|uniref:Uncharacterized protein LOC115623280 n=1 Tax=Drosophila lebanonensis TaxID=7225 RepID=A0A6J2TE76_DROLE|nr:uncharacterized protein LOC115623280 [Scaptodrosophila lebanonensis]
MQALLNYRYSFLAGAFAAGGSFFGKLPSFLSAQQILHRSATPSSEGAAYYMDKLMFQLLPLVLMVVCNVFNWRFFLKALQMTPQTLTATVLTAASNYVLSFILGALVYQEPLTALSGVGATLILAGLWFLCDTSGEESKKQKES